MYLRTRCDWGKMRGELTANRLVQSADIQRRGGFCLTRKMAELSGYAIGDRSLDGLELLVALEY